MGNSDKLPENMQESTKKPSVEGSQTPITPAGDKTPTSAAAMAPRRDASFGGSDASSMQAMIGGPFGGRTGNASMKAESINKLPI